MFLRNMWYVAAFADELAAGERLGRKYLNESVVVFRTASGGVAALEDRCSHRSMALSAGDVDGEVIRCSYHGLEFNKAGSCTRIPNQERIPSAASIRSYPTSEQDGLIWIWMGDPVLADAGTIIRNTEHTDPKWSWRSYVFHVEADWRLLVDNILDLTHVPYIHSRTIGGTPDAHYAAKTDIQFDGRKVKLVRHMPNSIPPKSYVDVGGFTGRIDRWQEVSFEPDQGMVLRVNAGGCDVGTGAYEGKRDHGFMLLNVHGITPETETTTHYLWSICTTAPRESGAPEILFDQFEATIREDEQTVKIQQSRISERPEVKFVGIASDGAVNQGRRLINSLYDTEHATVEAAE